MFCRYPTDIVMMISLDIFFWKWTDVQETCGLMTARCSAVCPVERHIPRWLPVLSKWQPCWSYWSKQLTKIFRRHVSWSRVLNEKKPCWDNWNHQHSNSTVYLEYTHQQFHSPWPPRCCYPQKAPHLSHSPHTSVPSPLTRTTTMPLL